jgi:hypothetical protein
MSDPEVIQIMGVGFFASQLLILCSTVNITISVADPDSYPTLMSITKLTVRENLTLYG